MIVPTVSLGVRVVTDIREQVAERAIEFAEAEAGVSGPISDDAIEAALPAIVKAITDRVREIHVRASEPFAATSASADVVWRYFCDQCGPLGSWPCPTVRLLDQIDAEMGVQ